MKRAWPTAIKVLTGTFATAMFAWPQAYTISAKPGVVNYIEGHVFLDGKPVAASSAKAVFVNAGATISTDVGKAEVLLTPGVFLRLSDNTQVKMVAPSLTDTQLEVKKGEAMVEADDIVKDSQITVMTAGATVKIDRNGLFKISAGDSPSVAVLEGKTNVFIGDKKTDVGKGREFFIADNKTKKFDTKRPDELYAWSNIRSEYNAAASYQASKDASAAGYGGVWGGYGFGGYSNPGWAWNSAFNSWSWLPGGAGSFYSPFGYGFFGPSMVAYAPFMYAPIYGGGGLWNRGVRPGAVGGGGGSVAGVRAPVRAVPVNAARPPATAGNINSPMAGQAARMQTMRSINDAGGFRTANGGMIPAGRAAAASGFGGVSRPAPSGGMTRGGYAGGARSVGAAGAGGGGGGMRGGGAPSMAGSAGARGGTAPAGGGGGASHR
jgi:hypothetical protein